MRAEVSALTNNPYPASRARTDAVCRLLMPLSLAALSLFGLTQEAFGHASERGYVLLLPTGHYMVAGAAAVAASFLVLALLPPGALARPAAARVGLFSLPDTARPFTSLAALLVLVVLVAAGFLGDRDPLENPLPLTIWTLLWVGLTLVQGLVFNLWDWINPWHGPYWLARHFGWPQQLVRMPDGVGYWPALIFFAGFAWFELIDIAPDDPARLANAVGIYALFTIAACLTFGHREWTRRGEFLSVFFGAVSRFAVLQRRSLDDGSASQLVLNLPGAALASVRPLPMSGVFFLLFALASVSFDGLSRTFFWLGFIGVNPLEFPGRSAVTGVNTAGLAAAFLALSAVFLLVVFVGERLTSAPRNLREAAGLYVWSIVPIALAYHFAHYLTVLLVNGQYALVALSDPFAMGWNLFGTSEMQVSTAVASGSAAAWVVWNLQAAAIIGGHMLAVLVAHLLAGRLHPKGKDAILGQLPLTALMVAYTVLGLWLLSTPTAG